MSAVRHLARFELRRTWVWLVALGVLAGLGAGVALAAAQTARRSSTAYTRLEAESGGPDAIVLALAAGVSGRVPELPQVERAWKAQSAIGQLRGPAVIYVGVIAGESSPPPGLFTPIIVSGRNANPRADDEIVITEHIADIGHLHVGDALPLKFLTAPEIAQFDTGFGEPDGPAIRAKVVGIMRAAVGAGDNGPETFSTPAFARRVHAADSSFPTWLVRLRHGPADLPAFRRALDRVAARSTPTPGAEEFGGFEVQVPSLQRPVVANTARVLVTGLLVFGGIAALAAVAGVGLALRRHFVATSLPNARTLSAVGVTPRQMFWSRWLAGLPFVAVGTVSAVVVALAAASIGPIGSLGRSEPHPGWRPNLLLLAVGGLLVALTFAAIDALAARARVRRAASSAPNVSRVAHSLAAIGAAPPVVLGTDVALEPGRGRGAMLARSALVATAIALGGIVAVMVFASSLHRVTQTPARWGWAADAEVADSNDQIEANLRADPRVAAVAPTEDFQVKLDGHRVTGRVYRDHPRLGWTVIEGRRPHGSGEVMLGTRLARQLGRGVGDRVTFRASDGTPLTAAVVGVGTGPDETDGQFGGGVLVSRADEPRVARTQPERNAMVAFAPGVDAGRAAAALGRKVEVSNRNRPADVDNLAQLGKLPELLIAFLAVLSVAVLAHSVVIGGRRRRRELDTLRAVGFVRRQALAVIVVAALVAVAVGLVIGLPLGVVVGRSSWSLTAHSAYVAGDVRVPWPGLIGLVIGALLVAVVVAAVPARRLTRAKIAAGLRAE